MKRWFNIRRDDARNGWSVYTTWVHDTWATVEERELELFPREGGSMKEDPLGGHTDPGYLKAVELVRRLEAPGKGVAAQRERRVQAREAAWEEYGM